jgi:hypothetical protein
MWQIGQVSVWPGCVASVALLGSSSETHCFSGMDIGMSGNSPIDREHDRGKGIASESSLHSIPKACVQRHNYLAAWYLSLLETSCVWTLLGCPKATVA